MKYDVIIIGAEYLKKLLHKEAFDKQGLIYGVGHAIYSKSDPRAQIFKKYVEMLSEEKGLQKELTLVTPKDNERNIRFYTERFGFDIVGEEVDGAVTVLWFKLSR